ncbi:MAG: ABC transporter substrate-binding protein [Candidatus Woesearchaeota archaeon]
MKKIRVIIVGLLILLSLSCKKETDVIKIGVILPLTGNLSFMGEQERNGMMLAQDEINENGKKVSLYIEDSKSNAKDGVSAAIKLIKRDKVDLLITSTTGISLAVKPIAEKNNIDLVAYCQDPDIAKQSDYVTRLYLGLNDEAKAFVGYIESVSDKRIAILYNQVEAWEKIVNNILEPTVTDNNHQLVFKENYPVGKQDLKNIVAKLKSADADILILLSYGFEFPSLFPLFIENNILQETVIMGGWGFLYPNIKDEWLEDILVSGPPFVFEKNTLVNRFSEKYKKQYGNYGNYDAAMAYNVIDVIYRFYDKSEIKSGERFKKLIKNTKIEESVVGAYTIDQNGSMIIITKLGEYDNGRIVISN